MSTHKRHSLNVTTGPRPLRLVDRSIPSPPLASSTPKPIVRRHSSISYRSQSPSIASPEQQSNQLERAPLTLVEKHSDLLHFIAQKESKSLELRSQLAILEAEILQLKRKWARIVNRGCLDDSPASVSTPAVFGGIVEGVQGVGRFIAAGLAIREPSPSSLRPTHSYSQSNPSSAAHEDGDDELTQILMVHDTGATPTMSPNPAFERQRQQRKQQGQVDLQPDLEGPLLGSSKLHRRKSRDMHPRTLEGPPSQSESIAEATKAAEKDAVRAKRATIHGFPPVSSIPGLAALTVGPASPVPSWVESVGKKWGELQRVSTFSKNQKRASILLSDVSQSIVSALSTPSSTLASAPVPSYFDPSAESKSTFNRTAGDYSPRTVAPRASTQLKPTKSGDRVEDEWNW